MQTNSQFLAEFCYMVECNEFLQDKHISRGNIILGVPCITNEDIVFNLYITVAKYHIYIYMFSENVKIITENKF